MTSACRLTHRYCCARRRNSQSGGAIAGLFLSRLSEGLRRIAPPLSPARKTASAPAVCTAWERPTWQVSMRGAGLSRYTRVALTLHRRGPRRPGRAGRPVEWSMAFQGNPHTRRRGTLAEMAVGLGASRRGHRSRGADVHRPHSRLANLVERDALPSPPCPTRCGSLGTLHDGLRPDHLH